MILKIKNIVSQLFSKSKLSEEEEKDLIYLQPWRILEIDDLPETIQEVGKRLKQQK